MPRDSYRCETELSAILLEIIILTMKEMQPYRKVLKISIIRESGKISKRKTPLSIVNLSF